MDFNKLNPEITAFWYLLGLVQRQQLIATKATPCAVTIITIYNRNPVKMGCLEPP